MAVLQWNCRGLFAHLEELKQHLAGSTVKYDVICLQETLLKPNRRLNLPVFNTVRKDRATSSGGALYTDADQRRVKVCSGLI